MIDLKGKLVKLFFKNGLTAEGFVRSWSAGISLLDSSAGSGYLIIHDTLENVMMVRVLMESAPVKPEPVSWQEPVLDPPPQLPSGHTATDPVLRARKLAELKKQQIQEHKARLAERLRRGAVVGASVTEANYEYPNLTKLKSIHRTQPQTPRSTRGNVKKL